MICCHRSASSIRSPSGGGSLWLPTWETLQFPIRALPLAYSSLNILDYSRGDDHDHFFQLRHASNVCYTPSKYVDVEEVRPVRL
jgi:hypothetical protein